jgi:hypothetical protein
MLALTPARNRDVHFVGAGLSTAAGWPNTPALLEGVLNFAGQRQWLVRERLAQRLHDAFEFFYPDAEYEGFRPNVVDFVSALRTFLDVGSRLRGTRFTDAPELYRVLKLAIANLLIDKLRELNDDPLRAHDYLDQMVRPGNVVITSNWDLLVERAARVRQVPVRLLGEPDHRSLLLLKLHGSSDWSTVGNTKRAVDTQTYAALSERLFPTRPYTVSLQVLGRRLAARVRAGVSSSEHREGSDRLRLLYWSQTPSQRRPEARCLGGLVHEYVAA